MWIIVWKLFDNSLKIVWQLSIIIDNNVESGKQTVTKCIGNVNDCQKCQQLLKIMGNYQKQLNT